jgi:sugar phosphate isomerase/epimerase
MKPQTVDELHDEISDFEDTAREHAPKPPRAPRKKPPGPKLQRPSLKSVIHVVDELLDRAAEEIWFAVFNNTHREMYREALREARGFWWGAFLLALEMDAFCVPGRTESVRPDTWQWGTWRQWVEDAAAAALLNRRAIAAAAALDDKASP